MTTAITRRLSIIMLLLLFATFVYAAGEKDRMLKRVPKINELKSAGIIGEKADGLLGFVKSSPADEALVQAENKDRKAVYAQIAKSQGVSAEQVARRRAKQIAEQAPSGHWLQNDKGEWVQKQ